jgi:rhomboid protease GluP
MRARLPRITGVTFVVTAFMTGLQYLVPGVLGALQRTPGALTSGEYWRLITPIVVHRGGWGEITVNLLGLALVGALAETVWGGAPWLVFYVIGGTVGEGAGLAWRPYGAGSSVAICGLIGALAVYPWRTTSPLARLGGAAIVLGGVWLTYLHNLHGPPLLAGACAAALLILWRRERVTVRAVGDAPEE